MKKNIIILGVLACFSIVIYMFIYNSTNKINEKNANNTFEILEENINYSEAFLDDYINTIVEKKDDIGYTMLNEDTKKIFNNDVAKYSEGIEYIRTVINAHIKEKNVTKSEILESSYINKNDSIKEVLNCKISTTIFEYIEWTNLDYYKKYNWFEDLKLEEYESKKYKISFTEIGKEDVEWEIVKK